MNIDLYLHNRNLDRLFPHLKLTLTSIIALNINENGQKIGNIFYFPYDDTPIPLITLEVENVSVNFLTISSLKINPYIYYSP